MLEFLAVILGPALLAVIAILLKLWLDRRRRARLPRPCDQVAVVFWKPIEDTPHVLLVHTDDSNPVRWVFPKGDRRPGESDVQAARRLFGEEAGVTGRLPETPFTWIHFDKDTQVHRVALFLVRAGQESTPQETWRHPTWFTLAEASERLALHRDRGRHIANADELRRALREAAAAIDTPTPGG